VEIQFIHIIKVGLGQHASQRLFFSTPVDKLAGNRRESVRSKELHYAWADKPVDAGVSYLGLESSSELWPGHRGLAHDVPEAHCMGGRVHRGSSPSRKWKGARSMQDYSDSSWQGYPRRKPQLQFVSNWPSIGRL